MRGYFTFLIVFAAFALLLSLVELNLNSKTHNLSDAITAERFYRLQMNVKEVMIESARQGALEGFELYASTHDQASCYNEATMSRCFKEFEAEDAAEAAALLKLQGAALADFDDGIGVVVSFGTNPVKADVVPDPSSLPSGWRISSVSISSISITMTSRQDSTLGTVVDFPDIKVYMNESTNYP